MELKRAWNILLSLLSHVGIAADMRGKTVAVPRRLITRTLLSISPETVRTTTTVAGNKKK